jgi:hypothetical protein
MQVRKEKGVEANIFALALAYRVSAAVKWHCVVVFQVTRRCKSIFFHKRQPEARSNQRAFGFVQSLR